MFAKHLLISVSALAAVAGLSQGARADEIHGGGASLPAPYLRQAANCYGTPTDLLVKASPVAASQTIPAFNNGSYNCSTSTGADTVHYISTGSGTGLAGFFSNDPSKYGYVASGTYYPDVDYGVSETPLGSAQVAIYNDGGTYQGVTVVASGVTPGTGQYPNPNETYGAMIQVPALIAPVTIAYDPVYKVENGVTYSLNIATTDGKLHLDKNAYCGIFTGTITDWTDSALTALNNGVSLKATTDSATSMPIQIVGRSDSSGTTSLWTRHLATVCGSSIYSASSSTLPTAVQAFSILADQSSGVAHELDFDARTQANKNGTSGTSGGRIGYVGPDYVGDYAIHTGSNTYNLAAATLKNGNGDWVQPTPAAAIAAFANSFTVPSTEAELANPAKWVASNSDAALGNPSGSGSYPIVGTSNFVLYTCYGEDGTATSVKDFLNWYYSEDVVNDDTNGVLAYAGLAALPSDYRDLIKATFTDDGDSNDLFIRPVSAGGKCSGKTGA